MNPHVLLRRLQGQLKENRAQSLPLFIVLERLDGEPLPDWEARVAAAQADAARTRAQGRKGNLLAFNTGDDGAGTTPGDSRHGGGP